MKRIAIIGGWPAGLMTAASILEHAQTNDFVIHLFEGNKRLGQKLLISGGGRCNVTTGIGDMRTLATKYVRGWDFFRPSLSAFSPKKTKKWFESSGVPLKVQPDHRVFPVSDDGEDVLGVFLQIFAKYPQNIIIRLSERIESIKKQDAIYALKSSQWCEHYDAVVLATGGNAYAHTGSRGDGYAFAWALGHTITPLWPSLSSFLIAEDFIKQCSGIPLPDAKICFVWENAKNGSIHWSLLCTHFGISGPLAFMLAAHMAWEDISGKSVSLIPVAEYSASEWNRWLQEQFQKHPKRLITSILRERLPTGFADSFIRRFCSHIGQTFASSISRHDREDIAHLLGNGIPLTLVSRRPGDEFVTAGGVETDEIHPETLESKKHQHLYFVGEILNIDGYTWGFSLQICWSTAYQAGKSLTSSLLYDL